MCRAVDDLSFAQPAEMHHMPDGIAIRFCDERAEMIAAAATVSRSVIFGIDPVDRVHIAGRAAF